MAVLLAAGAVADAQSPPPTEVYLASISVRAGRIVVGAPVNITNRPGYDNQPSFTPDGRSILYTSIRDEQADIYRYDLATRVSTRLTSTPESEYSPTMMPGGERFSVIRVERDSAQRLWSFGLDGSDPQIVFASIKPVGYHAWVAPDAAVLFLLGTGGARNALVRADRAGHVDTLARDIGRSLAAIPSGGFSFVQRMPDSTWQLRIGASARPASSNEPKTLTAMPAGADFLTWHSADRVLSAAGTKLLAWERGASKWEEVADLGSAGLGRLSRLAVSPDGRWLAIVAEPSRQGNRPQ